MSSITLLNNEQIARAIRLSIKARKLGGYTPPCIIGPPGCGKTDTINQIGAAFAAATNGKFKTQLTIIGHYESTDFGIPFPDGNGKVVYKIPEWLLVDTDDYYIWYLDEFDRAPIEVQNASLQLLLGGNIHGRKLGKNVFPVLSMNASTDTYTTPLSKAAANRLCFLYTGHSAGGQYDSWASWAESNDVHPATIAFPRYSVAVAEALVNEVKEAEELAFYSFRSVSSADRLHRAAQAETSFATNDILPALIAGCIGAAAATEFLAYHELFGKAPSIEEVENDPKGTRVPEEKHIRFALALALCNRECKRLDPVIEYVQRLDKEVSVIGLRKLIEKNPTALNVPALRKWCKDNAAILT